MELQSYIEKVVLVGQHITDENQQISILASLHKKFWSSAATDHEEATKFEEK